MKNRWSDQAARRKGRLDQLVYRSRLIGQEPKLCVWGGGNTSTKLVECDLRGRKKQVLRIKGSGSDLKSMQASQFSPLDLQEVLSAWDVKDMTDEEMVSFLAGSLLNPKAPRPSIEALVHAFLPYPDIDHTHADAILAVTNTVDGQRIARSIFGRELVWIPYIKPGFLLSKRLGQAVKKAPHTKGAILEKHGLVTWGETSKESYSRTIHYVSRAERYFRMKRSQKRTVMGGAISRTLSKVEREAFLLKHLPTMRSALSVNRRVVLTHHTSPAIMEYVNARDVSSISQEGPATPDHMLRTKRVPLFIKVGGRHAENLTTDSLKKQIGLSAKRHAAYFNKYRSGKMQMLDPFPRVLLIPGVGLIASGKDKKEAEIVAEIYEHSIDVQRDASVVSRYRSLALRRAFEMEYWSLELYKLSLAPPDRPLARRVVLVTGAVGAIGQAISRRLKKEGAHVVVSDINAKGVQTFTERLNSEIPGPSALGIVMDVTNEAEVRRGFAKIILYFGGLDQVVSNAGIAHLAPIKELKLKDWNRSLDINATGHFLVSREAIHWMRRQGIGGNIVYITTKNVLAPGKEFGAYSVSKSAEAQLCRMVAIESGEAGIRANMVNPDGIFEGSGLWNKAVRHDRARSHGISEKHLESFYQNRNLLRTRVTAEDVANSVFFLLSDESSKTSGCILTVDGGLREAFPR
jgi:rhamnulose-1-phosphate aldolase/alcohol dehydrogenase